MTLKNGRVRQIINEILSNVKEEYVRRADSQKFWEALTEDYPDENPDTLIRVLRFFTSEKFKQILVT